MAKEIKGFNKAYKNAIRIESARKYLNKTTNRRVNELVKQGIDREVAKVMVKHNVDK